MALTDHDNTDGVAEAEAVGAHLGLRIIPGIELSADLPGASVHILGIFLDYQQPEFQRQIKRFRDDRLTRAQRMVDALHALGKPIRVERVFEIAGEGTVGRPHVAAALLEAGHVATIAEAFDLYLAHGKPAYFDGTPLAAATAVELIHSVGGFASWAHPYEMDGKDWRTYLPAMLEAGIDGIEVYYCKDYGPSDQAALLDACAEHGLEPTVGSDFHGFAGMDRLPGSVQYPPDLLERLEARVKAVRAA